MRGLLFALVPGGYLLRSRLQGRMARISWFLINPVVIGIAAGWVSTMSLPTFLIAFVLAFLAWQSVYEIGYLENDIQTVKRESSPTLRLSPDVHRLLEARYRVIVGVKWLIAALLLILLALLDAQGLISFCVIVFAASLGLTRLAFRAHNTFRTRANIATYFALAGLKYAALPVSFSDGESSLLLVAVLCLVFPTVRTTEHACKVKYGFPWLARWVGDFHRFRLVCYLMLSVLLGLASIITQNSIFMLGALLSIYLLAVRTAAYVVSRRHATAKPEAYRWE